MAEAPNTGMDKAELRKLLQVCRKEPVNCAIGLGSDASFGLLRLDRVKQPKAIEKDLMKAVPEAKNTRFGTAFINHDDNPKLLKIALNRPIAGMARKLVKTLAGTGVTKVQIVLDDGTSVESAGEEVGEAAQAAAAPPPPEAPPPPDAPPSAATAAADGAALKQALAALIPRIAPFAGTDEVLRARLAKLAKDASVNITTNNFTYASVAIQQLGAALDAPAAAVAPPPPPAEAARPDADALRQRLATLIPRIAQVAGSDAALKASLGKLAADANVNLKTSNLTYAAVAIEQLNRALDGATPAAAPPPPPQAGVGPDLATLQKLLASLAPRIPQAAGTDGARKAALLKLATDANVNLKTGNLVYAQTALAQLQAALDRAPVASASAPAAAGASTAPRPAATEDPAALMTLWQNAKDAVDTGLNKLSAALRSEGDPDLDRIAELGLFGMTNGTGVGLNKALLEYRGAPPEKRPSAGKALRDAALAYKNAVFAHPLADMVDDNPWGVEVALRAKLGAALDTIAAQAA